uniref:Uncharacterized protein n=1 Tax=Populus davidiana TaxID=266767 RepID=A0A6M2FAY7_9ROSI
MEDSQHSRHTLTCHCKELVCAACMRHMVHKIMRTDNKEYRRRWCSRDWCARHSYNSYASPFSQLDRPAPFSSGFFEREENGRGILSGTGRNCSVQYCGLVK